MDLFLGLILRGVVEEFIPPVSPCEETDVYQTVG